MPPPTGTRTGRGGCLLRGGCGGISRSPGPPGEEDRRFFQELVFHAGLPELRPQTFDLGVLFRGHGISAEVGVFLPPSCDPVPDCLRHKTVRSGHPGHRPGPRTIPRTTRPPNPAPHPGAGTTQPHLDHFHPPPEKHQALQPPELSPVRVPAAVPRPHPTPHRSSRRVEPARQISTDHEIPHHIRRRMQIIKTQITTHRRTPRRTPGVGRQNHTNAATRTTPPSTSHNERNNTPRPHGTAPLGDDSGTPPRTPRQPPKNLKSGDRATEPRPSPARTGTRRISHDGPAHGSPRPQADSRHAAGGVHRPGAGGPRRPGAVRSFCEAAAASAHGRPAAARSKGGPRGSPRPRGRRQA